MVPARIKSSTGFSNDVVNITLSGDKNNDYAIATGFNSSEIIVNVERNQPPLFNIEIPKGVCLGISISNNGGWFLSTFTISSLELKPDAMA